MAYVIRVLIPFSLTLSLLGADTGREDYDRKIQALEQRVTQLENLVEKLANQREAQPLPVPQVTEAVAPSAVAVPVGKQRVFQMPAELIPDLGKVGAQAGILMSGSLNPYHLNSGTFGGGLIDLPLFNAPRWMPGKFSYELLVGLSSSKTTLKTTSNVAQVANLAVLNAVNPGGGLQNITDAVTGTGAAPFPVTTSTQTTLRMLEVVPFSMKYTTTALDRFRLRPYAVLGFGTYVTIHEQNPAHGNPPSYGVRADANLPPAVLAAVQQLFGGTSPFGAPLVAGQIGQSPELEALGLPSGHGNIAFGLHAGAGTEIRLTHGFSIGFDARFNRIAGAPGLLTTYGSRLGFHF
jgi:hypothetical protein